MSPTPEIRNKIRKNVKIKQIKLNLILKNEHWKLLINYFYKKSMSLRKN